MPLDATGFAGFGPEEPDYRCRRDAAAALWRALPAGRFDMSAWASPHSVCALGALAAARHDGWYFAASSPRCRCYPKLGVGGAYAHAAAYFGLTRAQAVQAFAWPPPLFSDLRRNDPEPLIALLQALPVVYPALTRADADRLAASFLSAD